MRIIVLGYHDIGYVCLKELIERRENILAVFTHKDNPSENIWFESVEQLARTHKIPVYTPETINDAEHIALIKKLAPDIIFSFYYRNLISKEILNIPRLGCINLHGSLLPRYRGRCPVNWVLVHGEQKTGVTLHYMEEKPDKGDIIAQEEVMISFEDTAFTLFNKMTQAAEKLFHKTFPLIKQGKNKRIVQDQSKASYFGGRKPQDGKIDWNKSAKDIYNLVRAVTHPYPGAFTLYKDKRIFVWKCVVIDDICNNAQLKPGTIEKIITGKGITVSTGKGTLLLETIQIEGGIEDNSTVIAKQNNIQTQELLH